MIDKYIEKINNYISKKQDKKKIYEILIDMIEKFTGDYLFVIVVSNKMSRIGSVVGVPDSIFKNDVLPQNRAFELYKENFPDAPYVFAKYILENETYKIKTRENAV